MSKPYTRVPTKTRQEWLKARFCGIGCSEVPTLFGIEPSYSTKQELFTKKVNYVLSEATSRAQEERFWMGHRWESVVIDWWNQFEIEKGKAKEWQTLLKSKEIDGLIGTPDGKIGNDALLEIKTINRDYYKKYWNSGRYVADAVYYQVQAQMALTGMQKVYVSAWRSFRERKNFLVERNNEVISDIKEAVEDFWHQIVVARETQ